MFLTSHATVGCSTGYMTALRDDWPALVAAAARTSGLAVELSALSENELPGLIAYLRDASLPFRFVSVHGPSKGRLMPDDELAALFDALPRWVSSIVMHPDSIGDPSAYAALGRRLCIENMDARKAVGQTADDLRGLFDALPDARLCFDIAHAKAVDPTMAVGQEILGAFSGRLSHVHLSSLDAAQKHVPLTHEDQILFSELLERCVDVPWILEASLA
jgi:Xylose isomerase-like TIM barrel